MSAQIAPLITALAVLLTAMAGAYVTVRAARRPGRDETGQPASSSEPTANRLEERAARAVEQALDRYEHDLNACREQLVESNELNRTLQDLLDKCRTRVRRLEGKDPT